MNSIIEQVRTQLWNDASAAGKNLTSISGGGPMGLTPDSVKASPEYRIAKADYERAASVLRAFNAKHKPDHKRS
jgi:hypothetical protein